MTKEERDQQLQGVIKTLREIDNRLYFLRRATQDAKFDKPRSRMFLDHIKSIKNNTERMIRLNESYLTLLECCLEEKKRKQISSRSSEVERRHEQVVGSNPTGSVIL